VQTFEGHKTSQPYQTHATISDPCIKTKKLLQNINLKSKEEKVSSSESDSTYIKVKKNQQCTRHALGVKN
jgi:hypothetical protein